MNEEEKEAIDTLKRVINEDTGVISDDIQDDEIETILGLINKQQKEIEDLKMQNYIIRDMNLTVRRSKEVFDEIYIRKDKITEIIQEITSYAFTSLEEKEKHNYAIYQLKRLLEE